MLEGYLLLVTGVQNWKIKKCRKSESRDINNINVIYVSGKADESKYKKIINALYRVLKNYDPDNKYHRQKSFINFKQQCVRYWRRMELHVNIFSSSIPPTYLIFRT